jgi:hypothetical protein
MARYGKRAGNSRYGVGGGKGREAKVHALTHLRVVVRFHVVPQRGELGSGAAADGAGVAPLVAADDAEARGVLGVEEAHVRHDEGPLGPCLAAGIAEIQSFASHRRRRRRGGGHGRG